MADAIAHRGPDDIGLWVEAEAGIAFGHRRLSIIDLSSAGHQPMASSCGRYVVTYNGEIYNFRALRRDLEAGRHRFRGQSDTEVLLTAIAAWGVEEALRRANGMFAFALWDRRERRLTLARDRAGKKPLYYGRFGRTLMFGSELKALRAHPAFEPEIDRDALGFFVQFGWVPQPRSIYSAVRQVPPGSFITFGSDPSAWDASPTTYWSACAVAERGCHQPFRGSLEAASQAIEEALREAVADRMVSDVPIGALLSGGIDSSSVAALMQSASPAPIKTFCIGFHEPEFDEAPYADAVARHLGTDHTSLYVTPQDALDTIPLLPTLYDEPFADSSQIPTFLVSRLARTRVKVVLSGDGGDEVFCGYTDYRQIIKRWQKLARESLLARRMKAALMAGAERSAWSAFNVLRGRADSGLWHSLSKISRRAHLLAARSPRDLAMRRRTMIARADAVVLGASAIPMLGGECPIEPINPTQAIQQLDFVTYMADDVLVKVDRASMGVGLEVRCPFLDQRVLELAWSLPLSMRLGPLGGKHALRHMLYRHVPPSLIDRPKKGFGVPVSAWLKGPLREWAESLIEPARVRREGFLRPEAVSRIWNQHCVGWHKRQGLLWAILMFQAWHESSRNRAVAPARAA
jgi:asparagine synthase (glutamine-hydrolysing)